LTADLVIIGAGTSGLFAAASATERGASVIVLEKMDKAQDSRVGFASFDSGPLREAGGIGISAGEALDKLTNDSNNKNVDQRLIMQWIKGSGESTDWAIGVARAHGLEAGLVTTRIKRRGYREEYPAAHEFYDPAAPLTYNFHPAALNTALLAKITEEGGQILFRTPAARLIVDDAGAVTGVLGQRDDGTYVQVDASKGVLLCAGGIEGDRELMRHYTPWAADMPYYTGISGHIGDNCTGDGLRLGAWAGGEPSLPPYQCGLIANTDDRWMTAERWLNVNLLGERYVNEDMEFFTQAVLDSYQPKGAKWVVYDGKWPDDMGRVCIGMGPYEMFPAEFVEMDIADGLANFPESVVTAGSLEELAGKMGVPTGTFLATVARYNELARRGVDEDFGKPPEGLSTIERAPFYAAKSVVNLFGTFTGLRINPRMQVIDAEHRPIAGLYAAGNSSGGFFGAPDYQQIFFGLPSSRAGFQGRRAALVALGVID
jgi:fumarate reductase flavoprotein subunit